MAPADAMCGVRQRLALCLGVVLLVFLSSCSSLGYYSQAVGGQLRLLSARVPVQSLEADPATPPALRAQLGRARDILDFAGNDLGLAVDGRYGSYVALDRPYVVYNLLAAPALSVTPRRWCYPLVGCAPYRGYFRLDRAQRAAAQLDRQGFDTYVSGVPAYSTLGWFDDPLLSSFIDWPAARLAALLIHELAHSRVWIPSDAAFNEAFASFVGRQGAAQWAHARGLAMVAGADDAWRRLAELLLMGRRVLAAQLSRATTPSRQAAIKRVVYADLRRCYRRHRAELGGGRYDGFMAALNNAVLASLSTYHRLEPGFERLFDQADGRWPDFFQTVSTIGQLPATARRARIETLADEQIAQRGDDEHTNQIQCKTLPDHPLQREPAGAEHDDVRRGRDG